MRLTTFPRQAVLASAIAVIVAGLVVSGATASRGAARSSGGTLSVGVQQGYNALPLFVASRHGFFKKAGITDVKYTLFSSLPAMLTAVAGGQLDVGYQSIPPLLAYDKTTSQTKLRIIAATSSGSVVFFAPKSTAIPVATSTNWKSTVLAWKGKKIGVPAPNGLIDLYVKALVAEAGLQPSDVKTVPVGVGPPAVAALQNNLVDVISGDALTLGLLKDFGKNILGGLFRQGPDQFRQALTGILFASDSDIQANPKTYVALTNGLVLARKWIADPKHKSDILDILVRKIGLKPDEAAIVYPAAVAQFSAPSTKISKQTVGLTLSYYAKIGVIPTPAPAYDFLVTNFAK